MAPKTKLPWYVVHQSLLMFYIVHCEGVGYVDKDSTLFMFYILHGEGGGYVDKGSALFMFYGVHHDYNCMLCSTWDHLVSRWLGHLGLTQISTFLWRDEMRINARAMCMRATDDKVGCPAH